MSSAVVRYSQAKDIGSQKVTTQMFSCTCLALLFSGEEGK